MIDTTQQLRSLITSGGELRLSIDEVALDAPGPDEVVVRVEAAPINPSDLAVLLGPADVTTLEVDRSGDRPVTRAVIPERYLGLVQARLGRSVPVGNEGAGVVVDAGSNARQLIGRVVSAAAGGMYTRYRTVPASGVMVFADGITPKQAASAFVNPMTALGMVSTMRLEGHTALVHTAAASNLGRMLNRLCTAEGIEVVNVVRSSEQAAALSTLGARYVVNSTDADFREQLTAAISSTGATLGFDAVGGGPLAGQILAAMESALLAKDAPSGPYGSPVHKQVYVYGRLDPSPTTVPPTVGMAWGIGGWLLSYHLARIGAKATRELMGRVVDGITTTFASSYTGEISLAQAIEPDVIRAYQRRATGEKYLIVPTKD